MLKIPGFFKSEHLFTIYRRTSVLYGPSTLPAGSFALDRQPSKPSKMLVEISGFSDGTGDIVISGLKESGASVTETISFSSNSTKLSTAVFASVSSITSNLLSSESTVGTLSIKARSQMGEEINSRVLVVDGLKVSYQPEDSRLDRVDFTKSGAEEIFAAYVYFEKINSVSYVPENRDVFYNAVLGEWEVANIGPWLDIFYQIRLKSL